MDADSVGCAGCYVRLAIVAFTILFHQAEVDLKENVDVGKILCVQKNRQLYLARVLGSSMQSPLYGRLYAVLLMS